VWQIKPLAFTALDQTKNARRHKVHPHLLFPQYDFSVWVDGKADIKTPYLFTLCPTTFKISLHSNRNCIYKECVAVECYKRDSHENIDTTKVDFEKFPGLNEPRTTVIFTKEGKGAGYARNVGLERARGNGCSLPTPMTFITTASARFWTSTVMTMRRCVFQS